MTNTLDLVYLARDFAAVDQVLALGLVGPEIVPKRFPHKRAFLAGDVCCEILLIDATSSPPLTRFWGDVPFSWHRPLLGCHAIVHAGHRIRVLSAANLRHHRAQHRTTHPERWRTFHR